MSRTTSVVLERRPRHYAAVMQPENIVSSAAVVPQFRRTERARRCTYVVWGSSSKPQLILRKADTNRAFFDISQVLIRPVQSGRELVKNSFVHTAQNSCRRIRVNQALCRQLAKRRRACHFVSLVLKTPPQCRQRHKHHHRHRSSDHCRSPFKSPCVRVIAEKTIRRRRAVRKGEPA